MGQNLVAPVEFIVVTDMETLNAQMCWLVRSFDVQCIQYRLGCQNTGIIDFIFCWKFRSVDISVDNSRDLFERAKLNIYWHSWLTCPRWRKFLQNLFHV